MNKKIYYAYSQIIITVLFILIFVLSFIFVSSIILNAVLLMLIIANTFNDIYAYKVIFKDEKDDQLTIVYTNRKTATVLFAVGVVFIFRYLFMYDKLLPTADIILALIIIPFSIVVFIICLVVIRKLKIQNCREDPEV